MAMPPRSPLQWFQRTEKPRPDYIEIRRLEREVYGEPITETDAQGNALPWGTMMMLPNPSIVSRR